MNYIYCGSHKSLLFALSIKDLDGDITVIAHNVTNDNIVKFCNSEGIDCIDLGDCWIIPSSSCFKIFSVKKTLDAVIRKINFGIDDNFFITGYRKAHDCFYLAKEFSKTGTVYYKEVYGTHFPKYESPRFKPIFFKGFFTRLLLKLVFGLDLIYYVVNKNIVLGLKKKSFFQRYNITNYKPEISVDELILDVIKKRKSHEERHDNLIIDGGVLVDVIHPSSLEKLNGALLGFPVEYVFKRHPEGDTTGDVSLCYKSFKHCPQIPSYIPAELICNTIKKNIISVFSASLITASQLNSANAVSLLELVEWKNPSWKAEVKKWLIKESKNKILFPNSYVELKRILVGI